MNDPPDNPAGWRPACAFSTAQGRARMLGAARQYFASRNVLEVETPYLSHSTVSDPQIESICCKISGRPDRDFYLRTSPEFAMKRLLCGGYPDIYEIGKVFRDNEVGQRHQSEFTMVEWYRHNFGLWQMIDETLELITTLLNPQHIGHSPLRLSYCEAFLQFVHLDPLVASIETLASVAQADSTLCNSLGDSRDDWLNLILARDIAENFPSDRLTVVHHYPASQAALSRICPDHDSLADRFEVFFGSMELANGYVELTDAEEQARRFDNDQKLRAGLGRKIRPLDDEMLAALKHGLPDCAGVAVGFDRLLMINANSDDIRKVQSISIGERQVDH